MSRRVRVFLDYWNFQLNWNQRAQGKRCDWTPLARVLVSSCSQLVRAATEGSLEFLEMRVYASVSPLAGEEEGLKRWLDQVVSRLPGYRVEIRERQQKNVAFRCRSCAAELDRCSCGAPLARSLEKGVDAAIVTDLLGLAWEGAYDLAILVSSDADFVPAVEHVQRKGLQVVNACWKGQGHNLAKVCWASFYLDELIQDLAQDTARERGGVQEPRGEAQPADERAICSLLHELWRAEQTLAKRGGYVGLSYFVNRWVSPDLPPPGEARKELLSVALRRGLVELVEVAEADGKLVKALRIKPDPSVNNES